MKRLMWITGLRISKPIKRVAYWLLDLGWGLENRAARLWEPGFNRD